MSQNWYESINPEPALESKANQNNKLCMLVLALAASLYVFFDYYGFDINLTNSLPQKLWLLQYRALPKRGDYVVFKPPKSANLADNITVLKQVIGLQGDQVQVKDRTIYINNKLVAKAKTYSVTGEALLASSSQVIKEGQYYVYTPHPDSFDSRYEKMGTIHQDSILGVAYPIW